MQIIENINKTNKKGVIGKNTKKRILQNNNKYIKKKVKI